MHTPSVAELIPLLQTAIGPVILISGVGMLLLTMTNRFGRAIDRARQLGAHLPAPGARERSQIEAQLRILWRRARMIRRAIILSASSALSAAVLIIVLFITPLLHLNTSILLIALFVTALSCLLASLVFFIRDLNLSLVALRLELDTHGIAKGET